ncbi:MAG TPA: ParA family protein [Acidimicrobiales bacterium]|nr:ParA family protein [Acidimicrobiales bacterium]
MSTTVAVINQKGGVGKTTVTLGLASAARAAGVRTLVVDLDPQGSSSWALGLEVDDATLTVSDAIAANRDGAAADIVVESGWGAPIDVLPAGRDLVQRDTEVRAAHAEHRLRRALTGVVDPYELVLIDCAPSLGLTTRNGLAAADLVLVVVEPAAFSLRGLLAVTDAIDDAWDQDNPGLDLAGVVVNKVPPSSHEADLRLDELAGLVGKRAVWRPFIPQRVAVNEALGAREPIHDHGARAHEVPEVFDALLAKLRRTAKKAGGSR